MKLSNQVVDISRHLPQPPIPIVLIQGLPGAGQNDFKIKVQSQFSGMAVEIIDSFPVLSDESSCNQCTLIHHLLSEIPVAIGKLKWFQTEKKLLCIEVPSELDVTRLTTEIAEEFGKKSLCFVQAIVTCIDFSRFIWDYSTDRNYEDRLNKLGLPKDRVSKTALSQPVLEDLINHIECTDYFFCPCPQDSVNGPGVDLLKHLQPRARFIFSDLNLEQVCFSISPTFNDTQTFQSSAWQQALFHKDPSPYCFRARRPFHPARLNALIDAWPESIVRSCGTVWLASHHDLSLSVSQVGPDGFFFSPEGYWLGTLPPLEQKIALQNDPVLHEQAQDWHPKYADRMTEIAFVSDEPLPETWLAELNSCLLSDLEMRMDWKKFPNPFPTFDDESEISEESGDSSSPNEPSSVIEQQRPRLCLLSQSET